VAKASVRKAVKADDGDVQAMRGIDLEIAGHEFVVLVGAMNRSAPAPGAPPLLAAGATPVHLIEPPFGDVL